MATCTLRVCTVDTGASPNTSAAFTPAANDLLVAVVAATATLTTGSAVTSTGGYTGTWTRAVVKSKASGVDVIEIWVADGLASAVSSDVTWTNTSDQSTGTAIFVYGVSGMTLTGASAIKQVGGQDNGSGGSTPAFTFPGNCLTGNPTIVGLINTNSPAGATPPSGWTESATPALTGTGTGGGGDVGFASPTTGAETAYRDSGFTTATVTWGATVTGVYADCGVELDTTAALDLTGAVFTKAPTFPTGAITTTYDLSGAVFTKAPTFPGGTVAGVGADQGLTGAVFTKAPTFPSGAVASTYDLTGAAFQKAPTFPTGAVTATRDLAGAVFQKAPTFPTGAVSTTYDLAGAVFTKAPTFPTGAVASDAGDLALTGVTFQRAPTFPSGAVTATADLAGAVFQKAPTFPSGAVTSVRDLAGATFTKAPTFLTGVLAGDQVLTGAVFALAPTFPLGTLVAGDLGLPVGGPTAAPGSHGATDATSVDLPTLASVGASTTQSSTTHDETRAPGNHGANMGG